MLLAGINPIIEISPNDPESSGHIRYFTFQTLEELLRKSGFRVSRSSSDCINFSRNGGIKSVFLARIFPKLGASVIFLAE